MVSHKVQTISSPTALSVWVLGIRGQIIVLATHCLVVEPSEYNNAKYSAWYMVGMK